MTFVIKRGDLLPSMPVTLTDNDVPVNLSTATAIQVVGIRHGIKIIDFTYGSPGPANGLLTIQWPNNSTLLLGLILFEFVVTWPGAKPQTFPEEGFVRARVSVDGT